MPKSRTRSQRKSPKSKSTGERLTKRALAAACGVTERTVDRWRHKPGFPDAVDGLFDLQAVAEWVEIFGTKSSEASVEAAEVQLRLKCEMLRLKRLERRRLQRADDIEERKMLPRDKYEAFVVATLTEIRRQFLYVPRRLAALVPHGKQFEFIAEAERLLARILEEASRNITDSLQGDAHV